MSLTADLLDDPTLMATTKTKQVSKVENITVVVSGSRFCLVPSLYDKISNLPWQIPRRGGTPYLHADPDVFELILQFFMFRTLPHSTALSGNKAKDTLQLLVGLDNVEDLRIHVEELAHSFEQDRKLSSSFSRLQVPAFFSGKRADRNDNCKTMPPRSLSSHQLSMPPKSLSNPQLMPPRSLLSYQMSDPPVPNLEFTDSTDSETSSLRHCPSQDTSCSTLASEQSSSVRMMKTLRNAFQSGKNRRPTHEEMCSTEFVL